MFILAQASLLSNGKVAKGSKLKNEVYLSLFFFNLLIICFTPLFLFSSLHLPLFSSPSSSSSSSSSLPSPSSSSSSPPSHRCEDAGDLQDTSQEEVEKIANEIEDRLYAIHQDITPRYKTKYRSLLFNLKDVKNQVQWKISICEVCLITIINNLSMNYF